MGSGCSLLTAAPPATILRRHARLLVPSGCVALAGCAPQVR